MGKDPRCNFRVHRKAGNAHIPIPVRISLAKMEIFVSLSPEKCGNGGTFNIADGEIVTWERSWQGLCVCFGLKGTSPGEGEKKTMQEFVEENKWTWAKVVKREGLRKSVFESQNWAFVHFAMVQFDFDREYDLSRAGEVDFKETIDTVEGYHLAWKRMQKAKMIAE
jgi:hypothetical protein